MLCYCDWCKAASGGGSVGAVAQLEQELSQVRSLMEGLSTQGSKLSETMHSMKPPAAEAIPPSARGQRFDDVRKVFLCVRVLICF